MDNQPHESPNPDSQPAPQQADIATIPFAEAIIKIIEGKHVTKLEWKNEEIYAYLKDNYIWLKQPTTDGIWGLSLGDVNGTDYVVLA